MAIEDTTKANLVQKAESLARTNKWLGGLLAVAVIGIGAAFFVKGDKDRAEATFEIGGQILTAVFENEKVTVVSATAPVNVTVASTTIVTSTMPDAIVTNSTAK